MDPYKAIGATANPDGSLARSTFFPTTPPSDAPTDGVLSKDVPLDPSRATWLRVFLPNDADEAGGGRLPVLMYFHGGGFVLYSAASAPFHNSCCRMARELPALVLSVEYRLAPEHRLPAAYDDAIDAVRWLRRQAAAALSGSPEADPWLSGRADFSRCFLAGSSSGGNIAYNTARRLLVEAGGEDLRPLQLRGLVLNQPFFGGVERTPSEAASVGDRIVPLPVNDLLWELSLPEGADRDHAFSNPMLHHKRRSLEPPETNQPLLPRCLLRGHLGDPLVDRQREFAVMLGEQAEETVVLLDREGFHAVEVFDLSKADLFLADVKQFVCSSTSSQTSPPDMKAPPAAAAACGAASKY